MSSRDDVDAVRSQTDILQVVAPYVALKRSGRVWKGLCPFHNEKSPSFQVNPDIGRWHCFGQCSEGGDAFKFLQKVDNLTFPEALERLALKAGITLTKESGLGRERIPSGERDRLFGAVSAAVRYYQDFLKQTPQAFEYLSSRGITSDTIEEFQIGFAGGDWETLPRYLDTIGVNREDAVKAGVLVASDRGGHFDKLKGRIVFPIFDVQNRPIAFGGRLMAFDTERPKYLNSAETPLFSKSKTLYGLSKARKAIADIGEAVFVEGYLDVITCHQAGFLNVIATLGTSLTEEHAIIVGRQARRVLLAFDSDAAGIKAAQRANTICEAQELEVRMLDLPQGEDPDSLIASGRADAFRRSIADSVPIAEYQLKHILASAPKDISERDMTTLLQREILPIIRSTKSNIERERYIRLVVVMHPFFKTGFSNAEEQIRQDVDGIRSTAVGQPFAKRFDSNRGERREYGAGGRSRPGPGEAKIEKSALEKAELIVIQSLLDPEIDCSDLLSQKLKPTLFVHPNLYRLARTLLDQPGQAGIQRALEDSDLQQDAMITEVLLGRMTKVPGLSEQTVIDSVEILTKHSEEEMLTKLRELSREGNQQANELYTRIMRQRKGAKTEQKQNV